MTRRQAFLFMASKYNQVKRNVLDIENKYFTVKGTYHQDITQDLYIKIYEELQKVEESPDKVLKFLDRYYNGRTFNIYTIVRNQYVDLLRKEKKYVHFDYYQLTKNEKKKLIQAAKEIELENTPTIQQKIDQYVETFYWFDKRLYNLYRYEFKQHRTKMSQATKISQATIYRTVRRCKVKINQKFKTQYYEK